MLSAPADLPIDALVTALSEHWGLAVDRLDYRPVGWGSHHWAAGDQWFVTVDDLETKRRSEEEPLDRAYDRLRAALAAATALPATIAVAPVATRSGPPLARCGERFAVAVYPYLEWQSFGWGEFSSPAHRRAVLDLVVGVHTSTVRSAVAEDFVIAQREALEPTTSFVDTGPYARATERLLATAADALRAQLTRYDALVASAARPDAMVLTHGEPHPGNTMLSPDGWRLIDWDTALMAPPERDLWGLDPGDGSILTAYAAATGVTPQPDRLELYRLRWDLTDIAVDASRFRRPHTGTADDDQSFELLRDHLRRL
jgi:aminoglycoside phosphotransferase (APT) family kinase protein